MKLLYVEFEASDIWPETWWEGNEFHPWASGMKVTKIKWMEQIEECGCLFHEIT